ncbi:hypothetical protein IMY05_003G0052800 [Salix suchowensis]|nr:hypothetical protein IMY05_003G0052800 [Salix suchowensis]
MSSSKLRIPGHCSPQTSASFSLATHVLEARIVTADRRCFRFSKLIFYETIVSLKSWGINDCTMHVYDHTEPTDSQEL